MTNQCKIQNVASSKSQFQGSQIPLLTLPGLYGEIHAGFLKDYVLSLLYPEPSSCVWRVVGVLNAPNEMHLLNPDLRGFTNFGNNLAVKTCWLSFHNKTRTKRHTRRRLE